MSTHDKILTTADTLTEPAFHNEPYTTWDTNRHRELRHHTTIQPGLLAQLYQAVHPVWTTTDQPGANIPTSRPPLEVEALSRHDQITAAAHNWCTQLNIQARATPESNIRALVGAASQLDPDQQKTLLADLRRWASWCRVYLGLEQVRQITGVRCPIPECTQLSTLRVNLTTATGLCTGCGATWDRTAIGVLGEHIKASRTQVA